MHIKMTHEALAASVKSIAGSLPKDKLSPWRFARIEAADGHVTFTACDGDIQIERTKVIKDCGYAIVLAKSQDELLAEGKKMHNCVGCGTYGRGIVDGDRLIVMLKKPNGRGYESFCDIEIDRHTWTVRQCYTKGNRIPPDEVRELANRIATFLKAEYKRQQKAKKGKAA